MASAALRAGATASRAQARCGGRYRSDELVRLQLCSLPCSPLSDRSPASSDSPPAALVSRVGGQARSQPLTVSVARSVTWLVAHAAIFAASRDTDTSARHRADCARLVAAVSRQALSTDARGAPSQRCAPPIAVATQHICKRPLGTARHHGQPSQPWREAHPVRVRQGQSRLTRS